LPTAQARLQGFVQTSGDADLRPHEHRVRYAEAYTFAAGRAAAADLLTHEPEVTGLFCANDLMALGAIEAARELALVVPHDLSVVGFDDIFVSALVSPPLTTVRQPLVQLGKEAAELAIALIEQEVAGPDRRMLPVELVVPTRPQRRQHVGACSPWLNARGGNAWHQPPQKPRWVARASSSGTRRASCVS